MKRRITFEVDPVRLFDALAAIKGNTEPLGLRIVSAMLTGDAGFNDQIGMAHYGVAIAGVETIEGDGA